MYERSRDGSVEVITGCMFAGKTEELLRRVRRGDIAGDSVAVFTPDVDDRFDVETIGSHDGRDEEAIVIDSETGCDAMQSVADGADVVAIDEGNFFDGWLVEASQELADGGARVIVSGLDQTYRGEPFSPMDAMLAVADRVDKLTAICRECGMQATRTQRLVNGEPATSAGPTVKVGGEGTYEPRCRHCHVVARKKLEP